MSKNETKVKSEEELQAEALKAVEKEAEKQVELLAQSVGNTPAQPPVAENPTDSKKVSAPKSEKKQKTKIADHMMKINGVYYQAGDEVPIV